MRPRFLLATALSVLLASSSARAATQSAKERAAKKACLSGYFQKGVELLSDLYLDTNDPTYIFNQGRCFEQNRRYEDAIARFREYLIKAKNITNEDRGDTERHIAACQAYLGKTEPSEAKAAAPPPPAVIPPAPPVAQPVSAPPAAAPIAVPQTFAADPVLRTEPVAQVAQVAMVPSPPAADTGRGMRVTGIVLAAVGATALVTGAIINLKVNAMATDLEKDFARDRESTRRTYVTAGWIAYGTGIACLGTGAVFYLLGLSKAGSAHHVLLMPAFAPGTALVSVGGTY